MSYTFSNEEDDPGCYFGGEGVPTAPTSTSAPKEYSGSGHGMDHPSLFGIDMSTGSGHLAPAPAPSRNFATQQNNPGAPFARTTPQNAHSPEMGVPPTYPPWGQQLQGMVSIPNIPNFVGLTPQPLQNMRMLPVGIPLPGVDYPFNPAAFSGYNRIDNGVAAGGGIVAKVGPHNQPQQDWSSSASFVSASGGQSQTEGAAPSGSTWNANGSVGSNITVDPGVPVHVPRFSDSASGASMRTRRSPSSAGSQRTRSSHLSSRGRSTNPPHQQQLPGQTVYQIAHHNYTHEELWENLGRLGNHQVIWDCFPSFSPAQLTLIFQIAKRDCENNLVGVPQGKLRLPLHSQIAVYFFPSTSTSHGYAD
jgi:hypothetical protein